MSVATILVTDKPAASAPLHDLIARVVPCEVVSSAERWIGRDGVRVVVADLDLGRLETAGCLNRLRNRIGGPGVGVIVMLKPGDEARSVQARTLGATLCLPREDGHETLTRYLEKQFKTNPAEDAAMVEAARVTARVRVGVSRAEDALKSLLGDQARNGILDLGPVETSLEPIAEALRDGGLARWVQTVRSYDDVTFQHCLLVAGLCARFALHLGFRPSDRQRFVRAALVHDVGKARIPLAILNKPGKLEAAEMQVMRTHAPIGYDMLVAAGERDGVTLDAVRHHHEALDGTGYPDRLAGEAISDLVRLLTICDIYAALIEKRPYKNPMTHDQAMTILGGMTTKLEGQLVDSFDKAVRHG